MELPLAPLYANATPTSKTVNYRGIYAMEWAITRYKPNAAVE